MVPLRADRGRRVDRLRPRRHGPAGRAVLRRRHAGSRCVRVPCCSAPRVHPPPLCTAPSCGRGRTCDDGLCGWLCVLFLQTRRATCCFPWMASKRKDAVLRRCPLRVRPNKRCSLDFAGAALPAFAASMLTRKAGACLARRPLQRTSCFSDREAGVDGRLCEFKSDSQVRRQLWDKGRRAICGRSRARCLS